jgi:hypothetical protein
VTVSKFSRKAEENDNWSKVVDHCDVTITISFDSDIYHHCLSTRVQRIRPVITCKCMYNYYVLCSDRIHNAIRLIITYLLLYHLEKNIIHKTLHFYLIFLYMYKFLLLEGKNTRGMKGKVMRISKNFKYIF